MPLPVPPVEPEESVRKDTLLVAVQGQPAEVITPAIPLPLLAGNTWLVGEIEETQMGTVKLLEATFPVLSLTRTVKLNVPKAVGVPLIVPEVDRVSPVGSEPVLIVQLNGPVPPEVSSVCSYGSPKSGNGKELVTISRVKGITSPGKPMVIEKVPESNC